jgi:hypothetical protein
MTNYARTLEIINLQHEIARREFETAINSPFSYPAAGSENEISEWQPLLEYPEPPATT